MAIINNPDCDDEGYLRGLLEELLELEDGLTEWEVDFIESVDRQGFRITEKQGMVIERIYDRLIGL